MKKFLKKLPRRLWRAMFPQYVLYVQHRGKQQIIHIKSLRKKTPTKITGLNMQGEEFGGLAVGYLVAEVTATLLLLAELIRIAEERK